MVSPKFPDAIDFLVRRRFPFYDIVFKPRSPDIAASWAAELDQIAKNSAQYIGELRAMAPADLQALHDQERQKKVAEDAAAAEVADQKLFFNQPNAKADFVYWSKAAYWSIDEAIALLLGKNPAIVKWDRVKPHLQYTLDEKLGRVIMYSPFADLYQNIQNLAIRAVHVRELTDPVLPEDFMIWAKRNDLGFPGDLEEQLKLRGISRTDWKGQYEALKAELDQLRIDHERLTLMDQDRGGLRETLKAAIDRVNANDIPSGQDTEKPLGTRERESLLKLVIGMAIKGYTFDPAATRNSATADIASDLASLGISLDPDTVRKWLKEGAELLPGTMRQSL